jgi:hypothetical protein
MYDELKAQKIQEMEGLVQEQDSYIVKMGEVRLSLLQQCSAHRRNQLKFEI